MSNDIDTTIRELYERRMRTEKDRIEADLLTAPGVHLDMTADEARSLGLEVVHQQRPNAFVARYRGIRQSGEWVIDHHPEWGDVA